VVADGRDVTDSAFGLSGGGITLDLVASANGAAAEGVATDQKNEPVANAVVVAVPEARFRERPDRYRKVLSDQSGRFSLRGLSPGGYTIFAWESVDGEAYYNAEFLKGYEGFGKELHVNESDHATMQIKVAPAVEDEP
jgi:hypothetical protein